MKGGRLNKVLGILFLVLFGMANSIGAQSGIPDRKELPKQPLVYRSDTLPVMIIPQVNIYDVNKYNYLKSRKYRRQIYNVRKAYPYAKIARNRLQNLDQKLAALPSKKDQKAYVKTAEKEIMAEFEDELRKLTIKQGIILVKLIDREVGQTSYEVVKEIRGGFTAFFWQGVARLFGNDLKMQYDPEGEDRVTEDIIMAIEHGFI